MNGTDQLVEKVMEFGMLYGMRLVAAIAIFVFGKWVAKILAAWTKKILLKTNCDETLAGFVKNICYTALLVFVVIAALNKLGVNTTSAVAVIGAAGLAVGMALQGSLSNFRELVTTTTSRPSSMSRE